MIEYFVAIVTVSHFTSRLRRGKKRLHTHLLSLPDQTSADKCHAFIEQKIDQLLDDKRTQQLGRLNARMLREIPEETKQDNRYLLATALNASGAVLLSLIAPLWVTLTVPVSLYLGRRPFQLAWRGLVHERRMSVYVVDAVAISAAILVGFWQITAISLFLYATALKLLNRAKQQSHGQLIGMFSQTPSMVWVQHDEVETEISMQSLQTHDIVVVRSGEVIPVDGVIVRGSALIDQRAMTGESQPVEKQMGDEVFACTLLLSGRIELQIQSTGQQTVAARIVAILQKTAEYKNQHEFEAERFTDRAAIPTLLLSAVALPISGASGAIGVLWSCFGYTMRIISPMSVMNFLRHACGQGILIKDGIALDVLANIDTVVFDKTGTLTEEEPELHQLHLFADYSTTDVLAYAAAAEYRQSHPIARAILTAARNQNVCIPILEDSHCKIGYGMEARIDGQIIHIGSVRFMEHSGIEIPEIARSVQSNAEDIGHSVVMIAISEMLVGAIELRPQLRASAYEVIQPLKRQGIRTCIISGDREGPTRNLSAILGIDQYFADTLPEQKALIVKRLQDEGRTVCFIGDGINDAIALKQADISVSLKGATTAAIDTAKIILMDGNLTHLATLIDMGHQFQKNQQQNMRLSMIPAGISIAGILLLHAGLSLAAIMFYLGLGLGVKNAMQPIHLPRLKKEEGQI